MLNSEQIYLRRNNRTDLKNTIVKRGGLEALAKKGEWYSECATDSVQLAKKADTPALSFFFVIPAGGQGDTALEVLVNSQDFPALLAIMSATDRETTLKAMAEELRYQICGETSRPTT